MSIRQWVRNISRVIFPELCPVCGKTLIEGEDVICLQCLANMPRTEIHKSVFNEIHKRAAQPGTIIERAASFFYYERHSPYAKLIHQAKYDNRPIVAQQLAEMFAREIMPDSFFVGIDIIEPVPLHPFKQLTRGYNQCQYIAQGLSNITGIPIGHHLSTTRMQRSQTRRNRSERQAATANLYRTVNVDELKGLHILIVDDVITTGSTIMACYRAITNAIPNARISVLSLGLSRQG